MVMFFDFRDARGSVPAHRHMNPDGTEGGVVADTARIGNGAVVDVDARVATWARVGDGARIQKGARVAAWAIVGNSVNVGPRARIGERVRVGSCATIGEGAIVNAHVGENAGIGARARIDDDGDVASGRRGTFYWTAWRYRSGTLWLTYGCETHALSTWARLHNDLAHKHELPGHGKITRQVVAAVKALLPVRRGKEKPNAL